jgi:hypothetical protein
MSDHLIPEDVTRRIAEQFLGMHPFLGDVEWDSYMPSAEPNAFSRLAAELAESSKEEGSTWRVQFTDPTGKKLVLTHRLVLDGISRCTYGHADVRDVRDWLMKPEMRNAEALPAVGVSAVCQQALFEGAQPYGLDEAQFLDDLA